MTKRSEAEERNKKVRKTSTQQSERDEEKTEAEGVSEIAGTHGFELNDGIDPKAVFTGSFHAYLGPRFGRGASWKRDRRRATQLQKDDN